MARKRNALKLKPVLFIACEGTSTEFDYFSSWAQEDAIKEVFQAVNVYPSEDEESPKTNPHQLVAIAKAEIESGSADIAWVVFDKDGHPLLKESFNEARISGINIAFSSRSFEEWVLMHFEKCNNAFQASECKSPSRKPLNCGTPDTPNCNPVPCLCGHIRTNGYISDYSKKKEFDLYRAIRDRTDIAMVNAAWLRSQVNASLNGIQPQLDTINPYTDVDVLISKLLNRFEVIEWRVAGTPLLLQNWIVNVSRNNDTIILDLSHSLPQSQALNQIFDNSSFYTTDEELNNHQCIIINKSLTSNQNGSNTNILVQGDIIRYSFHDNGQPYFLFWVRSGEIKAYIQLT